jgi:hypothetical protein
MIALPIAPGAREDAKNAGLWIGHPQEREILPEALKINLPKPNVKWIWVAYENGEAKAALYCADFHGIVFLSAIRATEDAKKGLLMRLLRDTARSCKRRGFTHFLTFLDTDTSSGLKMLRIMQKLKAEFRPESGVWASAALPTKRSWS